MGKSKLFCRIYWIAALCLLMGLVGPGLDGLAAAADKPKLTVWWNKGYYKEEDEGFRKVADDFARDNAVTIDLTFTIQDGLGPKIISALIAPGCLMLPSASSPTGRSRPSLPGMASSWM